VAQRAADTLLLFALTTLVAVGVALGPLGTSESARIEVLPVIFWLILLFAASAGLPRAFVHEEESGTATALRLAASPSSLFVGKTIYSFTLLLGLEAVVTPLYIAMMQLAVDDAGTLITALLLGGFGLAAGSTLIAAIIAQAKGRGMLFSVLAFPILIPLLLLAIALTRAAVGGAGGNAWATELLLYDATVTVAGLMLFPVVWNP
jgi:heme exporter protein B